MNISERKKGQLSRIHVCILGKLQELARKSPQLTCRVGKSKKNRKKRRKDQKETVSVSLSFFFCVLTIYHCWCIICALLFPYQSLLYCCSYMVDSYKYNTLPPLPAQRNLTPPPTLYPQQPMSTPDNYNIPRFALMGTQEFSNSRSKRMDINV